MNRFIRNNLLLIVIIACSCLTAVGLFVFSIIRFIAMNDCMVEIQNISLKVKELSKKNPRPHLNNKEPIEANTALYKKTTDQLAHYFKSPMRKVAEEFILGLKEREPKKDEPLTVEKFRKGYEDIWNSSSSYVDKKYNYNNFREVRFTNWNAQVAKYLPIAQRYTVEPLTEETLPEALFAHVGIPRTMGEQPAEVIRYLKNYQGALVQLMTSVKYNGEDPRVTWFGFDPDPVAASFSKRFTAPRDHYPRIAVVWEIFGDVIKRISSCTKMIAYPLKNGGKGNVPWSKEMADGLNGAKIPYVTYDDKIDTFHGLALRGVMGNLFGAKGSNSGSGEGGIDEAFRNAINGQDEGPFRVYRMRLVVSGSMEGIRTLVRALEQAYVDKEAEIAKGAKIQNAANADKGKAKPYFGRAVYVIRSVALYAERDGANSVFQGSDGEAKSAEVKNGQQQESQNVSRGRGRGRGRAAEYKAQSSAPKIDPAERERMQREMEKAYEKLPYYDRPGYGEPLIGDNQTCKAVIDFDCFQLK